MLGRTEKLLQPLPAAAVEAAEARAASAEKEIDQLRSTAAAEVREAQRKTVEGAALRQHAEQEAEALRLQLHAEKKARELAEQRIAEGIPDISRSPSGKSKVKRVRALHAWSESQGAADGDLFFSEAEEFELVSETVQELVPLSTPAVDQCPRCEGENPHCTFLRSEEEVDEYESNDDFDSEGQLKLLRGRQRVP